MNNIEQFLRELQQLEKQYGMRLIVAIDNDNGLNTFDGMYIKSKIEGSEHYLSIKSKKGYEHKIDYKAEYAAFEEELNEQPNFAPEDNDENKSEDIQDRISKHNDSVKKYLDSERECKSVNKLIYENDSQSASRVRGILIDKYIMKLTQYYLPEAGRFEILFDNRQILDKQTNEKWYLHLDDLQFYTWQL